MPTPTPYRRGLTKLWKPRSPLAVAPPASAPLLDRLLACRGLTEPDAVRAFVEPSLKHLHDPSLVPDLDRAAERLIAALRAREPIVIYGDYDVDGVTATAILYHTFRLIAPEAPIRSYIPHRLEEGYGLNTAAIEQLAAEGARVIISVDCGITAVAPALAAKRAGVDLIITDHHNPPHSDLPEALAIVHPRRPGSAYPFGDLSGAGVAYKLAWRLATLHCGAHAGGKVDPEFRSLLIELLSFAALGAIADIVPLIGENRVLTRHGLGRIKHSSNAGLRALVEASGLAGDDIDSDHVGFALGPRLNACGRMGHAREAVELFTTATPAQAAMIAAKLCKLNDERRSTERRIADQAADMARAAGMTGPETRAIVLAHPDWHAGVIGIVCSRLVDLFHRPTILMQLKDGQAHGSGRSIDGFSLHAALELCAPYLLSYGGHDMAAGLRLEETNLGAFVEAFTAHANAALEPDRLVATVSYDCEALLSELTPEAVVKLEMLSPFGMGNPRPRICLSRLRLDRRPETFGSGGKHLGLMVRQESRWMRMVAWNWGPRRDELAVGAEIDAIVSPKVSTYNRAVEPVLEDLRVLS